MTSSHRLAAPLEICNSAATPTWTIELDIQDDPEFKQEMPDVNKKYRPTRFQIAAARDLLHYMTQAELAHAAGVSEDTVSLFEAGRTRPHDSTIEKLQRALEARGIVFTNGDKPGIYLDVKRAVIPT